MKIFIDLILIQFIVVNIIDISGITDSIKYGLSKILKVKQENIMLKPFDCSYCTNFWVSLIYLLCCGELSLLTISATLFLSATTEPVKWLILNIISIINKIVDLPIKIIK